MILFNLTSVTQTGLFQSNKYEYLVNILSSDGFQLLLLPVLTIGISIYINYASDKDQNKKLNKKHLSVGSKLILASILLSFQNILQYTSDLEQAKNEIQKVLILVAFNSILWFCLWSLTEFKKRFGYDESNKISTSWILIENTISLIILLGTYFLIR